MAGPDPLAASPVQAAWERLLAAYRADESACVAQLHSLTRLTPHQNETIERLSIKLAAGVREKHKASFSAESFLGRFGLSTREGVVLMCLAEAFLRIPDTETVDELVRDKLAGGEWQQANADEGSLLLNASAWALLLTGKLASWHEEPGGNPLALVKNLVARAGEPLVRTAIKQAMRIMAQQFVAAETIEEATTLITSAEAGYTYSFDMLGEAARTREDAERYFANYVHAIETVGAAAKHADLHLRPGISVKLSALHPRYEVAQKDRVFGELEPRLAELARLAESFNISLTIDAEEAERLTLSLELFETVLQKRARNGWDGFGVAVQAYQKRAIHVIDWLALAAERLGQRITVRLVKGAYWDTEIKRAQQSGVFDYPVFTQKAASDLSYIVCAQKLLAARSVIYPQFATHNSRTVATILELAQGGAGYEFQKLYGMGDALYEELLAGGASGIGCRVYAPVGRYQELLPYLVRRILENGANSSFVHQIGDSAIPLETLVADPIALTAPPYRPNPRVPLPPHLYADRRNSRALDLTDERELASIAATVAADRADAQRKHVNTDGSALIVEPIDTRRAVGSIVELDEEGCARIIAAAGEGAVRWQQQPVDFRAACLERAANLMEERMPQLMSLCVREAGKTIADALAEVREAVDFCRYYAVRARHDLAHPIELPGPTGERNVLSLHPRGIVLSISPWNFPLAIFTGQASAGLVAGNAVIAKPAEQTPLIAQAAVAIFYEAGVPEHALQLAAGPGEIIGAKLVSDSAIAGVVFTGSVETARAISHALASREGPIIPFIAETGGQNAMIVDSSALPEQIVVDAIASAFTSAGQRCSALRLLFLQDEIAARVIEMLRGAMHELRIGDPALPETDVGPVIDADARAALLRYIEALKGTGTTIAEATLPPTLEHGHYVAPIAVEITLDEIPRHEVFGPVLHVIRYDSNELDAVLNTVKSTGYALTLGIQSRIDGFVDKVTAALGTGNTYVNRNMIGAVVGVQPFGGERLSGTGPKAGGPFYLQRFVVERTLTINTAAIGGNVGLLTITGE